MTNAGRILSALRVEPGLSDAELRQRTGVDPHQQVNQICRRLEQKGYIRRLSRADGLIRNYLTESVPLTVRAAESSAPRSTSTATVASGRGSITMQPLTAKDTLIVLPCSGRKVEGGASSRGPSVLDLLSPTLRAQLVKARQDVGVRAALDESRLLPAWRRYVGTLYMAAAKPLDAAVVARVPVVIISGGYGLVLADESIGLYDRRFSLRDWPPRLLEDCLATATEALRLRKVVGFCARSTDYAELIRRTAWSKNGIETWLASPDLGGRGGAQVLVPQASGEAVEAFLDGELHDGWTSAADVPVRVERVENV